MPIAREDSGAFVHLAGAVDTVIAAHALLNMVINQPGTTISIYDNTSGTGTPVALLATAGPGTYGFNVRLTKGLHIITTGSPDITLSYI